MELLDLSQQLSDLRQGLRSDMNKVQSDISRLQQTVQQQQANVASVPNALGTSIERTGYNLSVSLTSFGAQLKLAFLWGMCIFGAVVGTVMAVLLTVLLGKGGLG